MEAKKVWKVFVSAYGEDCNEHGWHSNGLTFDTKEAADEWGNGLMNRWSGAKDFRSVHVEPDCTKLMLQDINQ